MISLSKLNRNMHYLMSIWLCPVSVGFSKPRWRHQMETFPLWALCMGNFPRKGQWRGNLMFSLIYAWTNSLINNRHTSYLRRHRAHYDLTVMEGSQQTEPYRNDLMTIYTKFFNFHKRRCSGYSVGPIIYEPVFVLWFVVTIYPFLVDSCGHASVYFLGVVYMC